MTLHDIIAKRAECIKRCNQEIQEVIDANGVEDGEKTLSASDWEKLRRASNDIEIAMNLNDDEPITQNWYGLFDKK